MKTQSLKLVPETYYEDVDWTDAHLTELTRKYADQWIAVVSGQVVAAGTSLARVKREAARKTNKEERQVSVFYIMGANAIYASN